MSQRILITGAGIVSPLGLGWRENEVSLASNRTAFRPVDLFDVSERIAKSAASVNLPTEPLFLKMPKRRRQLIDRGTQMLMLAIREALATARLPDLNGIDAIVIGTSAGAMMIGQDYFRNACSSSQPVPGQLSRLEFYQPQRQLRAIAEEYEWHGPLLLTSNACASGANAIGDAMTMIQSGRARRVLAGGYDALAELVFAGFDTLRALAPSGIPRPFDANRDGLALGEGAGVVILESEEAAAERGAEALCDAAGYATATDLHHLTQPDPEGKAAIRTMTNACIMAGVRPDQVDYINSHGTGTPYNDVAEASAIRSWAGDAAKNIAVSSTKSAMGHLLGGAGAVEAVICLMVLRGQWLPGSLNIREVDPAVSFDLVQTYRPARVDVVLTNSFGFGGTNATLVFTKGPPPAQRTASRSGGSASAKPFLSNLVVHGVGAVSPAGWGATPLVEAVTSQQTLPLVNATRTVGQRDWDCLVRMSPPAPTEALPKFPRLRRASAITKFAMGAALEALENAGFPGGKGAGRLGLIQCMFNGCVQFSGKFYHEVINTPALASPLIFPETVYNAPASHVAAYLGIDGPVTTLMGESNVIMEGLMMAQTWLDQDLVDHCLVIGAEECDWLAAEATMYYSPGLNASEGAGALLVSLQGPGPRLSGTEPFAFHHSYERKCRVEAMVNTLRTVEPAPAAVIDHVSGIEILDANEAEAWSSLPDTTQRLHPRKILGEGMGCASALQLVLAVKTAQSQHSSVCVSLPGSICAAYGALVTPATE